MPLAPLPIALSSPKSTTTKSSSETYFNASKSVTPLGDVNSILPLTKKRSLNDMSSQAFNVKSDRNALQQSNHAQNKNTVTNFVHLKASAASSHTFQLESDLKHHSRIRTTNTVLENNDTLSIEKNSAQEDMVTVTTSTNESFSDSLSTTIIKPTTRSSRASKATTRFRCDICLKAFQFNSDLKRHHRTHSGEKPFGCDECGKRFAMKGHLTVHKRTHSGERPFGCDICGKAFAMSGALSRHRRIHTGEKPYKCSICPAAFAQRGALVTHSRRHFGEKPYPCAYCKRQFSNKVELETHALLHGDGKRANQCKKCPESFLRKSSLQQHELMHVERHTAKTLPIKSAVAAVAAATAVTGSMCFICALCGPNGELFATAKCVDKHHIREHALGRRKRRMMCVSRQTNFLHL